MTRIAVIGAGAMGRNHARVARDIDGEELVGVCDVDEGLATAVGRLFGAPAFVDHHALLERARPEAVVVAAPTSFHHGIVRDVLRAGCHVLVEKPIAATVAEAQDLAELARTNGRVLMVGHIERYNPAVVELYRRLRAGELGRVIQLHARRLGPFPLRVRDVGVVIDLATHDLDIMRYLTGSEAARVFAETRRKVHTSREDMLNGLVRFRDDTVGVLEINWLTPTKIRELFVTGERGMFQVDYLTQDLYFYENAETRAPDWSPLSVIRGVSEGVMTRFAINKVEPLRAEHEAFAAAVCGRPSEVVTADDGLAALRLALAMIDSADSGEAVTL